MPSSEKEEYLPKIQTVLTSALILCCPSVEVERTRVNIKKSRPGCKVQCICQHDNVWDTWGIPVPVKYECRVKMRCGLSSRMSSLVMDPLSDSAYVACPLSPPCPYILRDFGSRKKEVCQSLTSALPLTPAGPSVYRGIMRFETFMNNSILYNPPPLFALLPRLFVIDRSQTK